MCVVLCTNIIKFILHFVRFSFHHQFTMNANSWNIFMNEMTKDEEGFPSFLANYVVSIGENGVGSSDGGSLDLKQVVMK